MNKTMRVAMMLVASGALAFGGCNGAVDSDGAEVDELEDPSETGSAQQELMGSNTWLQTPTSVRSSILYISGKTSGWQSEACTATRVGPRLILTAAHCVQFENQSTLFEGYRPGATFDMTVEKYGAILFSTTLQVLNTYVHPDWHWAHDTQPDLALVEIQPNGLFDSLPISPINVGYTPAVGAGIVMSGYGNDATISTSSGFKLRFGYSAVESVWGNRFFALGPAAVAGFAGVARGDSGGPVFRYVDGYPGYVIGVNSAFEHFDDKTTFRSFLVRLDTPQVRNWLAGFGSKVWLYDNNSRADRLQVRVANAYSATVKMDIWYQVANRSGWQWATQLSVPPGGGWNTYTVDLSGVAAFNGRLTAIALNPKNPGTSGSFGFEYIRHVDRWGNSVRDFWFDGYAMASASTQSWGCDAATCSRYQMYPSSGSSYWTNGTAWSALLGGDPSFQITNFSSLIDH